MRKKGRNDGACNEGMIRMKDITKHETTRVQERRRGKEKEKEKESQSF